MLLYFITKKLWAHITRESNRYKNEKVDDKARRERTRIVREGNGEQPLRDIRRRLRVEPDYSPREIMQVMGLLVAHMLSPTRPFSDHWALADDDALPGGNFGRFIARIRCTGILSELYFCNNDSANKRDKLWKLRAFVDVIQARFLKAWCVCLTSYLLMKVFYRLHLTCFQVWHDDFEYGTAIPGHLGKRVVLRRTPKAAGAHKIRQGMEEEAEG
ncbi:hypothetical protein PR003_g4715 [Phytophthora rubi]|uniref:PiggyBac transposable element-derived protein domain-containing protein n=1 Tax=Phytophthora rubi TaxID=129364 RepID=A0A6A3NT65_9STRA|nr:hypothetical protein PR002_g4724 [Phytophthora rubi]KAE9046452.1 hypothetical protein PR001_g4561 [Phytophthora rubi]KAE9351803.1 hypothetical protein PR003_g4715 [Phytophthora rubi]